MSLFLCANRLFIMLKARCTSLPEEKGRPYRSYSNRSNSVHPRIFIKYAGRPAGGKPILSIGPLCRNISLQHIEANRLHSRPSRMAYCVIALAMPRLAKDGRTPKA